MCFKEISKAWKQAIPVCQKMSWQGRRLAWLNRNFWMELRRKKRRDYHLWKKEQATQEDYKDVVRFWRMKIRRDEVQLELNLYTIKNISMYTVAKKKGGAENLPPFLYVVEHIAKG